MSTRLLLLLLVVTVGAGQSYFNMRGLGEIAGTGNARAAALADQYALSAANPGLLVDLNQTSFGLSAISSVTIGTNSGRTRAVGGIRPASFGIAIPLPVGLRLSAAARECFNQDFDIWSDSVETLAYRRHVIGRGGIYSLKLGITKSLFEHIALAASYKRLLGGSREDWRFDIDNGGFTSVDTIEVDYSGNTYELAASYQHRFFTLAAVYEPPFDLVADRYRRVHGVVSDSLVTYRLHLPYSLHFGAAARPTENLGILFGLSLRPWSSATITAESTRSSGYLDSRRISAGVEYLLKDGRPIRLGYGIGTGYYEIPDGLTAPMRPITERSVHLGTALPVPGFGSLELAGELVFRNAGLSETSGRLMLELSYHEPWARRTRRWGY
jgi:hypothetical protein